MKNNPKLLECLFGHHDFFTHDCVRQCKRCRVVQVHSDLGWLIVSSKPNKDFDLEAMYKRKNSVKRQNYNRLKENSWSDDQWTNIEKEKRVWWK